MLVQGAFIDGSGWQSLYEILTRKGYHLLVTQQPLNSFDSDVAAVKQLIDQ